MAAISDLSLADVLHQAPRIFRFLQHGHSLNVLLATNTGTRDLVQQYVTHITIPDQSHMLTFAQDQWPSLQRMSLKSVQDPSAAAGLSQGDWQISRLEPTFAKLDLNAILALRRNTWPWQMLTDLAVYFRHGMPVDLHMLSSCQWLLMESLTLCSGRLDDAQAAVIFWAHWPKLTSLDLSDNTAHVWTPLTWHQLIEANWPMLSSLDLGGNGIKATMMKNIVEAQFSCVRKLNLSDNSLDSIAIGHLVKGPWLQLCEVQLNRALCGSIADCLVVLSTGNWPQLKFLWLVANEVDVTALPALAKSNWPSLFCLDLMYNPSSSDDFRLMGGDAACDEPRDICRKVWPKLQFLEY